MTPADIHTNVLRTFALSGRTNPPHLINHPPSDLTEAATVARLPLSRCYSGAYSDTTIGLGRRSVLEQNCAVVRNHENGDSSVTALSTP